MAKTYIVRFRITRDQREQMLSRAKILNKINISDFLRFVALEQPLIFDKIYENNRLLKEVLGKRAEVVTSIKLFSKTL